MANRYSYIDKKGSHLHTLDSKPLIGTSTVVKVLSKPLTWWASGMAVSKFGWLDPKKNTPESVKNALQGGFKRVMSLSLPEYEKLLTEAYKAHSVRLKEAGTAGVDRHELLEVYVKHCIMEHEGRPYYVKHCIEGRPYKDINEPIQSFIDWALVHIEKFLWSELHCYNESLWTGGIADVGWEDKYGRVIAGDFKSSKEAYFDQYIQVAGYDLEISHSGGLSSNGDKIFELPKPIEAYCIIPFGGEVLKPEMEYNTEKWQQGFKSALELHKLSTSFKQ